MTCIEGIQGENNVDFLSCMLVKASALWSVTTVTLSHQSSVHREINSTIYLRYLTCHFKVLPYHFKVLAIHFQSTCHAILKYLPCHFKILAIPL